MYRFFALALGGVCYRLFPESAHYYLLAAVMAMSAALLACFFRKVRKLLGFICYSVLGMLYVCHADLSLQYNRALTPFMGKTVSAIGKIESVPHYQQGRCQFIWKLHKIEGLEVEPISLWTSWYHNCPEKVVEGGVWQFTGSIKPFRKYKTPNSFDQVRWAKGKALTAKFIVKHGHFIPGSLDITANLRKAIVVAMQSSMHSDAFSVAVVMIFGNRAYLSQDTLHVFQTLGLGHLLAISGLHVGMLLGTLFSVVAVIIRCMPFLSLSRFFYEGRLLVILLMAVLLVNFVDDSLSLMRAMIALMVGFSCLLWRMSLAPAEQLLICFVLCMLVAPLSLFSISLWLSFSAVALLVFFLASNVFSFIRLQGAMCCLLLPQVLFWFHQVTWLAFFANLITVPVISFIVMPLMLGGVLFFGIFPSVAHILWRVSSAVLQVSLQILHQLERIPHYVSIVYLSPLTIFLLFLSTSLYWFIPWRRCRWLCLWVVLPVFFRPTLSIPEGQAQIDVLEVGQGLSVLVRSHHHALLYDAGPADAMGFDAGKSIVVPYLLAHQVNKLDVMMISHGDQDHVGGAASVFEQLPAKKVYASGPRGMTMPFLHCLAGQHWQWDGVSFDVLYPFVPTEHNMNDDSCVLKVTAKARSVLLVGDIEAPVEHQLVEHYGHRLAADTLVAAHHGSRTSSTWSFIQAVGPIRVVYSVGDHNRFHFPDPRVMLRFYQLGVRQYRTDQQGTVSLRV